MYFVYNNNMQMYLLKEEIVIKTWNQAYKFSADEKIFESIRILVGYIDTPKTFDEIAEYFLDKKEFDLNKTIGILLKTKVIMMQENIDKIQNKLIYRYEDAEAVLHKMETRKIQTVNISERIIKKIQSAGMKIETNIESKYILVWNDGNLEQLQKTFNKYRFMKKKIILAGIYKGYVYILSCDEKSNDIRKACYHIINSEEELETVDYQICIAEKILENQCMEYFFAEKDQYNFTFVYPDLSVKNERLNYQILMQEDKEKHVLENLLFQKETEKDYADIDKYINQLPFVGYFGSKGCQQMPLPKQTLWLINPKGELDCKISAKGDTCETAMLNCICDTLVKIKEKCNTVVCISDNRENYYFEAISELLFQTDLENVIVKARVQKFEIEVICYQHTELEISMIELHYRKRKKKIYGRNGKELLKKVRYGLIELSDRVEESIKFAKEIIKEADISEINIMESNINNICLKYLRQIGYLIYEKEFAYSKEMKEKGLYAGEFLLGKDR